MGVGGGPDLGPENDRDHGQDEQPKEGQAQGKLPREGKDARRDIRFLLLTVQRNFCCGCCCWNFFAYFPPDFWCTPCLCSQSSSTTKLLLYDLVKGNKNSVLSKLEYIDLTCFSYL